MNLEDYVGSIVNIITTDGKEYTGYYVENFCDYLEDADNSEDSIEIKENEKAYGGVILYESEIESIEKIVNTD